MNIDVNLYVELLQEEVRRLRQARIRTTDRSGASMAPIEVNADKISPENRPAVGNMIQKTNHVLDFLNKEHQ